jgi:phosphoenolpyruvate synthase/pyruvate phosphate dikinase
MFIKFLKHMTYEDEPLIGNKNNTLSKISQDLKNKGINVPNSFILNKNSFIDLLKQNKIKEFIIDKTKNIDINNDNEAELFSAQLKIKHKILHSRINIDLLRELSYSYEYFQFNNKENIQVDIIPLIEIDDLKTDFFKPYIYENNGIIGIMNIRRVIKKLYSNIFSIKFIKYIINNNIDIYDINFSIRIHKTIINNDNDITNDNITEINIWKNILKNYFNKEININFDYDTLDNKLYLLDIELFNSSRNIQP